MLYDGINLEEGSEIFNTTVASGSDVFPIAPNVGELFFKTSPAIDQGLYIHDGIKWNRLATNDSFAIPNGSVFPPNPSLGDVYYLDSNDSSESLYYWNGDTWVTTGGGSTSKQSFSGSAFPTDAITGHTFYLTAGDVGMYVLTPEGWERIESGDLLGTAGFTFYRFKATELKNKNFNGIDLSGKTLKLNNSNILVFANGSSLQPIGDYTLNISTSTVLLNLAREIDDEVNIVVFDTAKSQPAVGPQSGLTFPTDAGVGQTFYLTDGDPGIYVLTPTGWEKITPQPTNSTTFESYKFKATAQRDKNFNGVDLNGKLLTFENKSILVFVNGSALQIGGDFSLNLDTKTVSLMEPRNIDDEINIIVFNGGSSGNGGGSPSSAINSGEFLPIDADGGSIFYQTSGETGVYIKTSTGWERLITKVDLPNTDVVVGAGPTMVFYKFTATSSNTQNFSGEDLDGKLFTLLDENVLVTVNGTPTLDFSVNVDTSTLTLSSPVPVGTQIAVATFKLDSLNTSQLTQQTTVKLITQTIAYDILKTSISSFLRFTQVKQVNFSTPLLLNIPIGSSFQIEQVNSNNLTFLPVDGAQILTASTLQTNKPHAVVTIIAVNDTTWLITGDLAPASNLILFKYQTNDFDIPLQWANKFIRLERGAATGSIGQLAITTEANNDFNIGDKIEFQNVTNLQIDFVTGSEVYFETATSTRTTNSKYGITTIMKVAANNWTIYGNLEP